MSSEPTPLLNPKNQAYLQGDAPRPHFYRAILPNWSPQLWWWLVIIGISFIPATVIVNYRTGLLETTGEQVWAQYVSRRISKSDDSTSYYITVTYTVNGQLFYRE